MAKVRKFENGLKLSIRGKIVGLLLNDMDSMVRKAMTIEREIEDAVDRPKNTYKFTTLLPRTII